MWLIIIIAITVAYAIVGGWLFMLMIGMVHHEWLPMMPTISFWPAVVLVFLLRLIFSDYTSDSK